LRRGHVVATLAPGPLIAFAISATGEARRIAANIAKLPESY
jgi:hypothetical protein